MTATDWAGRIDLAPEDIEGDTPAEVLGGYAAFFRHLAARFERAAQTARDKPVAVRRRGSAVHVSGEEKVVKALQKAGVVVIDG